METVGSPHAEAELHLLTQWGDSAGRVRRGWAGTLSIAAHITAIVLLLAMPETLMQPAPRMAAVLTPLIAPPLELTQKDPNTNKLIREFKSSDLRPPVRTPAGPAPDIPPAPRNGPPAAPPPAKTAPPLTLPEPPKTDVAVNEAPKLSLPVQPPQIQPVERPAFEDVTVPRPVPPDQRVVEMPNASVASAIRGNLRGPGINTQGRGITSSSSAELPQLLSDPQGVDFRAYLAQVLAAVKGYWYTIMPASVKSGRRGRVSVQFAILRDGTIRKAAFAEQTGDPVLDRAAIAAISGATPFAALPPQYRGTEIHVQINFAYNVPKE